MRALLVVLVMTAVISGCAAQASGAQPVDTAQVAMPPSYRFDPVTIRVAPGTAVTWTNQDNFTHAVQVVKEGFPSLTLAPGKAGSITFDQPGEYDYVCTFHAQNMKGKVTVADR